MDKPNCMEMSLLLLDYMNTGLTGEEAREMFSHLASCAMCRDEAAFLVALKKIAGALAAEIPEDASKNAFQKIKSLPDGCEREDTPRGAGHVDIFAAFGLIRDALYTARKTVQFVYRCI